MVKSYDFIEVWLLELYCFFGLLTIISLEGEIDIRSSNYWL